MSKLTLLLALSRAWAVTVLGQNNTPALMMSCPGGAAMTTECMTEAQRLGPSNSLPFWFEDPFSGFSYGPVFHAVFDPAGVCSLLFGICIVI